MSLNLVESIVSAASKMSFRNAAEEINRKTEAGITFQSAWNVVQKFGDKLEEEEAVLCVLNGDGAGWVKSYGWIYYLRGEQNRTRPTASPMMSLETKPPYLLEAVSWQPTPTTAGTEP